MENIILGTPARDDLMGTSANDIITGFQGRDTIDLETNSAGSDHLVYQSSRDAGDVISGFVTGEDLIDLSELFANSGISVLDYDDAKTQGYLSFGSRGDSAIVLFDQDGSGGRRALAYITVEDTTLVDLDNANNFIVN